MKDDLLTLSAMHALASPHRMRIVAALHGSGRQYVSQLARAVGLSRPLLHLHLQKLVEAGLVSSSMEVSKDGKALHFFEVTDFAFRITPDAVATAASRLPAASSEQR